MPRSPVYAFESIDDTLPFMPLAGRRLLDTRGRKLSLEGWLSLSVESRWAIVRAGEEGIIGAGADGRAAAETALGADGRTAAESGAGAAPASASDLSDLLGRAVPPASIVARVEDPDGDHVPPQLADALGPSRPLDDARWQTLGALDRYALVKCSAKAEKLDQAYHEIVRAVLFSHVSESGHARMVDVAAKPVTSRRAVASARVRTTSAVVRAIADGHVAKGDVLGAARIAGIMASKRTAELIPLCHPVQTTSARIDLDLDAAGGEILVLAAVEAMDRTGVEMEAMVAASIASLTIYDMIKSADRWAVIEGLRLERKSGGKSGDAARPGGGRG